MLSGSRGEFLLAQIKAVRVIYVPSYARVHICFKQCVDFTSGLFPVGPAGAIKIKRLFLHKN